MEIQSNIDEFFQPETKSVENTKVADILMRVQKWDYIPTQKCIEDTFNVSPATAKQIYDSLLNAVLKDGGYKYVYSHRRFRLIREMRSSFSRILRNLEAVKNLQYWRFYKKAVMG